MPPELIVDPTTINFDEVAYDTAGVESLNPHRGDMRMIDRILYVDPEEKLGVACKDVREEEFWVPGHIPGRPIFPGVLMIECAAQLASAMRQIKANDRKFMGFTGLDDVKFRGQVVPGDCLVMACQELDYRPRRVICLAQGFVNGSMVMQAKVTGMII